MSQLALLDKQFPAKIAGWQLDAVRQQYWHECVLQGLPNRKQERWKYTSLQQLVDRPYAFNTQQNAVPSAVTLAKHDYYAITFVDGVLNESETRLPAAIAIHFVDTHTPIQVGAGEYAFSYMNAALAQAGYLIEIPAGTTLDKPIVVNRIYSQAHHMSHYVNRVKVGRDASVAFMENTYAITDAVVTVQTDIMLEANAALDWMSYIHRSDDMHLVTMQNASLAADSRFTTHAFDFGAQLSRSELSVELNGSGASCELSGLYYATGNNQIDQYIQVNHRASHTCSKQHFRGIADDAATTVFNGVVFVEQGLKGIEAHQYNPNLMLSKSATMNTKPELLIYADDIQCSHGATVGQMEADALFYLRSRGIDVAQANAMLLDAFAATLLESLQDDPFKEMIHNAIYELSHQHA